MVNKVIPSYLPDDFYDKPDVLSTLRDRNQVKNIVSEQKSDVIDKSLVIQEVVEPQPLDIEKIEAIKSERDEIELVKSQIELYDKLERIKERQKQLGLPKSLKPTQVVKRKQEDTEESDDYDPLDWKKKKIK